MKLWLGMGSGTLPGDPSMPADEPPGSANIKKPKKTTPKRKPSTSKKSNDVKKQSRKKK